MRRIPVTILTGFLGAGKTTFLNRLISAPEFADTAVIVNEFGEAGVDGVLVAESDERAFAMSTGCLCCTVSGDVRLTLLRLLDEAERGVGPSFDRVVIETTGLADPAPLLQTFMANDPIQNRFTLNGVVTLVDAVNGADAISRFPEAQRQVAVADMIFVTKSDLLEAQEQPNDLPALLASLQKRSPNAVVKEVADATAMDVFSLAAYDLASKPPDVSQWLGFQHSHDHHHHHHHEGHDHDHHHHHDANKHGDTASAYCFQATTPIRSRALKRGLETLQNKLGPDLLRAKGLIEMQGHPNAPRILHVVGHSISPMRYLEGWPDGVDKTRIVLIISGEDRDAVAAEFAKSLPQLKTFTDHNQASLETA